MSIIRRIIKNGTKPNHQIKHQESTHQRIKNTNFTSKPNPLIEIFPIHLLTFLLLNFTFNGLPLTVYSSLLTFYNPKSSPSIPDAALNCFPRP